MPALIMREGTRAWPLALFAGPCLHLRFAKPAAEKRWNAYEAKQSANVDRLAYLVLLVQWMAGMFFVAANHSLHKYWNARTLAVPLTHLLLLLWSSLQAQQYVNQRRMLILSARLMHWPSSTWAGVLAKLLPDPHAHGLLHLLKTTMLGCGVPSALVYGMFLRVDLGIHALLQLLTVSRYMLDNKTVCSLEFLQQERAQAWLRRIERSLPFMSSVPLLGRGTAGLGAAELDRCFAFLATVQLLVAWGLPVYVAYLLDRSSRRRWVQQLCARDMHALLTRREREYWMTLDFAAINLAGVLAAIPLMPILWRGALMATAWIDANVTYVWWK